MTLQNRAAHIAKWFASPRFANVKRSWTPETVVSLQGSYEPIEKKSNIMSKKFWNILENAKKTNTCEYTFGALDVVQMTQMCKYLNTVYVSGWQTSSTESSNMLHGPDLADYPYNSVPNKVEQLFRGQVLHDRKQFEKNCRNPDNISNIDYYSPIIADADTGHGGPSSVMKMVEMFVDAGAAGIHIEDQKVGAKKCGHMNGKILCSMQEQINRLKAARLQCDILGTETLIIGRTDAQAANLIETNIDPIDKPFLLGKTPYSTEMHRNDKNEPKWNGYKNSTKWKPSRTVEGFYHVDCGLDYAIARAKAMEPYVDVLWCELDSPSIEDAKTFADSIDKDKVFLAINTSPSFNWGASGLTVGDLKEYHHTLGQLGYSWSFITLAGYHLNGLAAAQFAKSYKENSMFAYVNNIQDKQKDLGLDIMKHQTFSGAELVDAELTAIMGDNYSTSIQGANSTENQF